MIVVDEGMEWSTDEMRVTRENLNTQKKPVPLPLCLHHISH